MDWKNLHGYIEVSPFMLIESTGDSEQDSDLSNSSFDDDDDVQVTPYDEVDDAQSCCSDPSEIENAYDNDQFGECSYDSNKIDLKRVRSHDDYDFNYRHQNDYDEDEDDDDGAIDQECSSRNVEFGYLRRQKKCKVYGDCKMEPMKKQETDKLFWDACLAS
ncbi:hypothetical protein ACET3Z_019182 [Daucus carota]